MTQIRLNVPPGFVATTQAYLDYLTNHQLPEGLLAEAEVEFYLANGLVIPITPNWFRCVHVMQSPCRG